MMSLELQKTSLLTTTKKVKYYQHWEKNTLLLLVCRKYSSLKHTAGTILITRAVGFNWRPSSLSLTVSLSEVPRDWLLELWLLWRHLFRSAFLRIGTSGVECNNCEHNIQLQYISRQSWRFDNSFHFYFSVKSMTFLKGAHVTLNSWNFSHDNFQFYSQWKSYQTIYF